MDDFQRGQIDNALSDYIKPRPLPDKEGVKEELKDICCDWAYYDKQEAEEYIENVVENAYRLTVA